MNSSFKPNQYVACMYDGHQWIGVILAVDISFMHPHGLTWLFSWPRWDGWCLVSFKHVLCCISTPCTVTGLQYNHMDQDIKLIHKSLSNFVEVLKKLKETLFPIHPFLLPWNYQKAVSLPGVFRSKEGIL